MTSLTDLELPWGIPGDLAVEAARDAATRQGVDLDSLVLEDHPAAALPSPHAPWRCRWGPRDGKATPFVELACAPGEAEPVFDIKVGQRRGASRKPADQVHPDAHRVTVRPTAAERERIKAAATRAGLSVSEWALRELVRAAG